MTKTKQNKQRQKQAKRKPTPFADAGRIAGQQLGQALGMPYLKGVGKWLGSGIGQIFGSGDYTMVGQPPGYNVLANGKQIPKFSSNDRTNIVCHREYIGDINGQTNFFNRTFPLNPGMRETFPWLSTVATNYQQYKFHGLIFEFRPLITDFVTSGAPGVVVFATNYNADRPAFTNRIEMENSEYAVSVKPTLALMHCIECAEAEISVSKLYVRSSIPPSGQDLRLYDLGLTQFASQSNPTQVLGELWVSYCVEFFKPILPKEIGGDIRSAHVRRATVTNANPFGTIGTSIIGDLDVVMTGTVMSLEHPGSTQYYYVDIHWEGGTAAAYTAPVITVAGGTIVAYFTGGNTTYVAPQTGVSATKVNLSFLILSNEGFEDAVTVTLDAAGSLPTTSTILDMTVTHLSKEAVA